MAKKIKKEIKVEEPKIKEVIEEKEIIKKESDNEPVIQKIEKKIAKKELSDYEKINKLADIMFEEAKNSDKQFITLVDKNKNYWNSGDSLHLHISQGRCRELPDEVTEVLRHALSDENKLLRKATELELMQEMRFRASEQLIVAGEISPRKIEEEELKL